MRELPLRICKLAGASIACQHIRSGLVLCSLQAFLQPRLRFPSFVCLTFVPINLKLGAPQAICVQQLGILAHASLNITHGILRFSDGLARRLTSLQVILFL